MPGRIGRALQRENQVFREVLVDARERADLTQRQLAERLGWTRNAVARVEIGERRLDVMEFRRWCAALEVTPETILRRIKKRLAKEAVFR